MKLPEFLKWDIKKIKEPITTIIGIVLIILGTYYLFPSHRDIITSCITYAFGLYFLGMDLPDWLKNKIS